MRNEACSSRRVQLHEIIEELREVLPVAWIGSKTGELTGGLFHWPTLQNKRAKRLIPDECFIRVDNRVAIRRDPFLRWAETTMAPARRPPVIPPPRRGRRRDRADSGRAALE
jgi:hypothetical protein